jgi:hypothetical protein
MHFVYAYINALLTDLINSSGITFLLINVIDCALLKTRFHFISLSMLLYTISEGSDKLSIVRPIFLCRLSVFCMIGRF